MQRQRLAAGARERAVERVNVRRLRIDKIRRIGFEIGKCPRARLVAVDVLRLIPPVRPDAVQADIGSDIHDDGRFPDPHLGVVVDLVYEDLVVDIARVTFVRIDHAEIEPAQSQPLHFVHDFRPAMTIALTSSSG